MLDPVDYLTEVEEKVRMLFEALKKVYQLPNNGTVLEPYISAFIEALKVFENSNQNGPDIGTAAPAQYRK